MPFFSIVDWYNKIVGWYDLFAESYWNYIFKVWCYFTPHFCVWSERFTYTSELAVDNFESTRVLIAHMPGGVGLKNLFHFGQGIKSQNFQLWDYDMEFAPKRSNWEAYGQPEPPQVDLTKIRDAGVPVAIFASKFDLLTEITDQRWTRDQILNGEKENDSNTLVYYNEWDYGHYSFMVAEDMSYLDHVKQLLKTFNLAKKKEEIYVDDRGKIIIWVDEKTFDN